MTDDRDSKPAVQTTDSEVRETVDGRRDAMLKLAKYTAPAMLAVLLSQKSASAS